MEASEFKIVIGDILDILHSCDLMRNVEVSECDACCSVINENESRVPCEDCGKQFHVMCTGAISHEARMCDARLIWICSACGSNNIAHRIFDKIGIPCHFNRYELLEDLGDDDFHVDVSLSSCKSNQRKKPTKRLKKRYVRRKNKRGVLEMTNVCVEERANCDRDESDSTFTTNLTRRQFQPLETAVDDGWTTVKSRKTKMIEKAKLTTSQTMTDNPKTKTSNKSSVRSVNGVILQPGVTYIGKAMKAYYLEKQRRVKTSKGKKSKVETRQEEHGELVKRNMNANLDTERNDSLQVYAESVLNVYSKCVQSPHVMAKYSEQIYAKTQRSWADVAKSTPNMTNECFILNGDQATCVSVLSTDIEKEVWDVNRFYGGGNARQPRKKGRFTKIRNKQSVPPMKNADSQEEVDEEVEEMKGAGVEDEVGEVEGAVVEFEVEEEVVEKVEEEEWGHLYEEGNRSEENQWVYQERWVLVVDPQYQLIPVSRLRKGMLRSMGAAILNVYK
ncbi:uncharacterized protein [Diadema setosum]|uniref:uncharacterized protein n=1 Tax=Diadema setosum TaxID=31175 RepID=UPI003B3A38A5